MKKNVILTSADEKYANFLINHWLKSLKENVNLSNIDVVVLDYGLNEKQIKHLQREKVIIFGGVKNGHVVNMRFLDAARFLKDKNYDQVLFIDCGDIIFQEDISNLFAANKEYFRAAFVEAEVLYFEWFIPNNFSRQIAEKLWKVLKNKKVLNAGVFFAPSDKFISLCGEVDRLISNKNKYGPDQVVVNYVMYKEGVKLFERKYNYMINTAKGNFYVKDGTFYIEGGEKIAIVHNAGRDGRLRSINNFGYKRKYYKINYLAYYGRRIMSRMFKFCKRIIKN